MRNIFSALLLLPLFGLTLNLLAAETNIVPVVVNEMAFHPGAPWSDTETNHINCHGGCILREKNIYYWFGEYYAAGAASCLPSAFIPRRTFTSGNLKAPPCRDPEDTNSDFTRGCTVERPKVLHNPKTGQYVMWFHLELRGRGYAAARAGVAVSDKITGPYQFLKSFRPNDNMSRDMNLYLDDDGKAYEIYAARDNYDMRICQLSDDFLSPTTNDVIIASDHREAPAPFKYQGKYYLITSACTRSWAPQPGQLLYCRSHHGPVDRPSQSLPRSQVADTTFDGQSTFVLPMPGKSGAFIFMADQWQPRMLQNSGHVWLPIQINGDQLTITWQDQWDLSWFDRVSLNNALLTNAVTHLDTCS